MSVYFNQSIHDSGSHFDKTKVLLFARFETADEHKLPVEISSLQHLRSIPPNDSSVESPWIEGIRDQSQDSLTFMLNGEPYDKWYYHWESGSHKTQRATKHVLKAYVLYQANRRSTCSQDTGQNNQPTSERLDLLCIVTSPPFTLVSYRRSSLNESVASSISQNPSGNENTASVLQDEVRSTHSELHQRVHNYISRNNNEEHFRPFETDGDTDETFELCGPSPKQNDQLINDQLPIDRFCEFQERERLQFSLLSPEDAALSNPLLHSQIQSQEQRLVFHRKRYRDENQQIESNKNLSEDRQVYHGQVEQFVTCETKSYLATQSLLDEDSRVVPQARLKTIEIAAKTTTFAPKSFSKRQFDRREFQLQQLTDLAIIHGFLSHFPNRETKDLELILVKAVVKYWHYEVTDALHLSRLLLIVPTGENTKPTSATMSYRVREIVRVLLEVCVWIFASETVELAQHLMTTCYPLLDGPTNGSSKNSNTGRALLSGFLKCVGRCWSVLDEFLHTNFPMSTMIHGVHDLSDAILSVVYSDLMFQELRPELQKVLERPEVYFDDDTGDCLSDSIHRTLLGWRGFVAQLREGYLVRVW